MSDEIQLILPAEEEFRHIAHLVVGGFGARIELTFDDLEDLQVGLDALLACRHDDGEVSVVFSVVDGAVLTSVGPLPANAIEELAGAGDELGLRRVLETVCERVEVDDRGDGSWVALTKRRREST